MEGLLPCIYRAVVRRRTSSYQILSHSRSSSKRGELLSSPEHSSSGRSYGQRDHVKYNYTTGLPMTVTADSGRFAAAQDFQLKPTDRTFPSITESLRRQAGKQSLRSVPC